MVDYLEVTAEREMRLGRTSLVEAKLNVDAFQDIWLSTFDALNLTLLSYE